MSYVDANLMKDEEVLYRGKVHWSFWIGPTILALLFGIVAIPLPPLV